MLFNDLRRIARLHVAVPDGFGIYNNDWAVLALIETERLVDAHFRAEARSLRQLLQLGEDFAFSVGRAGGAGRVGGTDIVANKDMMFKFGQAVFLLG
jgi:hypothetical protein